MNRLALAIVPLLAFSALARMDDALKKSTPITKELEGEWLVDKGDMHLVLKLANDADGVGGGVLVAPEENNAEVPVTRIVQTGSTVLIEITPRIEVTFEGEMNKGGTQISGTWTMHSRPFSITLVKRAGN
jgi:hypothetical protein